LHDVYTRDKRGRLEIPKFSQHNIKRLRWENLGTFSQSQLRTYLVKSNNNTFRGVNWKILRLSKVLVQFTEKGGNDCFDIIHGSVDNYRRRER
jgi:hypothetical protein